MASLSGVFNLQSFTDGGVLASNYRLYTYEFGTTTHKVAYTDAAGAVPHTYTSDGSGGQYIALNARGELPGQLYLAAGSYAIALKRPDGSTVRTDRADPVSDAPATALAAALADLANTADAAKGDALVGTKRTATGAIGTTLHAATEWAPLSVFDFMTAAQIADVQSATPSLNHTVAWQAWSAAVEASKSRHGYIPGGTYLIDSWTVTARGVRIEGASPSSVTLSNSVKIKARSIVTDFVTWESSDSRLSNVEIDGNNFATKCLRMANQTFEFAISKVYVGGAVNNGCNVDLSGITTNTQVADGSFYDCIFFGSGSRAGTGATGITNLKINSNQSLVLSFFRCKFAGNDTSGADMLHHVHMPLGTASFFGCFWTVGNAAGNDVRIGNGGAAGGSVGLYDCRSESTLSDSIYADGGAGDVVLSNYVHATSTKTSLTLTNNFTGRCTVIGGQQYNTTNSASAAQLVLLNMATLAGGAIGGSYVDRIIRMQDGLLVAARFASRQDVVTYSASITLRANQYDKHYILVTNGTAFTMNAPTGPSAHQTIVIDVRNGSGGAMGAITWNAVFKLAGAFVNPASGFRRKISFTFDGTNWIEDWRMAADGAV